MLEVFQTLGGVGALVGVVTWFANLERITKRHNRLVRHEYEDLITWARDDLQEEGRRLDAVKDALIGRGMLGSGEYGHQLRLVRNEFAQRWRDRKRASDRKLEDLNEAEGGAVRLWRKLRGDPLPANPNAEELQTITAAWEDEEARLAAVAREVQGAQH